MTQLHDENRKYWATYGNHQRVKHVILREYINGWFPKLGHTSGRLIYIDSHAGRSRHCNGEGGSPIVALRAIRDHRALNDVLRKCEVVMAFMEGDQENAAIESTDE